MQRINKDYIYELIKNLAEKSKTDLDELEKYADENNVPIVTKEVANFLRLIIKLKKPRKILEFGTAIGYSGILMLNESKDAHLTTVEINEDMFHIAKENFKQYGFSKNVKQILDDGKIAVDYLNEKFDIIFIDSDKGHYKDYFVRVINLLEKDGIIILDNVLYKGMVACEDLVPKSHRTIANNMRDFLEYVCDKDEFISSVLPLGDGIMLVMRK
ncbi:MAG: O-methyltransferase [Tissierellia bacterium]|nr:O-methyltransferase [Tissierellia bacterium]